MSDIRISWLFDDHDCETCGSDYAEGARVVIDGEIALDLTPVAYCFDGKSWEAHEVFREVLKKLGHTISEEGWR